MDLLALLAQNYIRWRHGLIGTDDRAVFDETESMLTRESGVDVSTLNDAAITALFTAPVITQDVLTTEAPTTKRTRKDSSAS